MGPREQAVSALWDTTSFLSHQLGFLSPESISLFLATLIDSPTRMAAERRWAGPERLNGKLSAEARGISVELLVPAPHTAAPARAALSVARRSSCSYARSHTSTKSTASWSFRTKKSAFCRAGHFVAFKEFIVVGSLVTFDTDAHL